MADLIINISYSFSMNSLHIIVIMFPACFEHVISIHFLYYIYIYFTTSAIVCFLFEYS